VNQSEMILDTLFGPADHRDYLAREEGDQYTSDLLDIIYGIILEYNKASHVSKIYLSLIDIPTWEQKARRI